MSGDPRPKQGKKPKKGPGNEFSASVKEIISYRSKGTCEARTAICRGEAVLFHHIRRRGKGGKGTVENGLHLCTPCHTWIHDHVAESERAGWLRRTDAG